MALFTQIDMNESLLGKEIDICHTCGEPPITYQAITICYVRIWKEVGKSKEQKNRIDVIIIHPLSQK